MSTGSALRVFLCHSRADKDRVGELYRRLVADGFAPWLDEEDLLPGQNWRAEIASAVRASDFVLVCLSETSTTRAGYVHKEIKEALDVADEQPEGTIYVIPARLESCELPVRLSHLHAVDLFAEVGYPRLVRAMRNQASAANASRRVVAPAPSTSAAVPSASRRRRVIGLRSALPAPTPSGDRSDATAIGAASSPVAVGPAHPAAPAPSQAAAQAPPAEVARPQAPVYAPTIYVRDPDSGPSGHGITIRPVYRNDILPTGPRQSLPEATIAAANRIVGESAAVGRNDPCWCGSGKKFKKCPGA